MPAMPGNAGVLKERAQDGLLEGQERATHAFVFRGSKGDNTMDKKYILDDDRTFIKGDVVIDLDDNY